MTNNLDNDILFDMNDKTVTNHLKVEELRKITNQRLDAQKRVVNKLLDILSLQNDISALKQESIIADPDVMDEDMMITGKIEKKSLMIDIPPIKIQIDLALLIKNAMLYSKPSAIRLLIKHNINIFSIETRIMIMCVETDQDELMEELIRLNIPIDTQNYRCLYQLAANGKLDLIQKILKNYCFPNVSEIIAKICIQAIYNNHVNILEYFFPQTAFTGAPDQMFFYFIKSIEYGGHLSVIKFFIRMGINIKQNDYTAVYLAIKFNRPEIIKYFSEINNDVINLLTDDEKQQFGLMKIITINRLIDSDTICNITYDKILEGESYYECTKKLHHFSQNPWDEWMKKTAKWSCPHCCSPVRTILYINKQSEIIQ